MPNGVGPYQEAVGNGPAINQPATLSQTTTAFPAPPSDAEAIAAKRELVPAAELAEAGRHIAPAQARGLEIESVAGATDDGNFAANGNVDAPLAPPLPDYLPVDGAPAGEAGLDPRPLAEQVAEAGEHIAPAQQQGREIETTAGDGWEAPPPDMPGQGPSAPAETVAMKSEAAPAAEVAAAAERIAPAQQQGREIETFADGVGGIANDLTSAPSDASDIKVCQLVIVHFLV